MRKSQKYVYEKKVDKGTASRSLLLYCLKTQCLLKNRERGSEALGAGLRGSYFSRCRFSEGILGDPGELSRFRMRSSRRVPDALLRPPGGLAKAVEGFVADRGQLGPNAKRGLLWSSPRSSNRDPIHRIGCDFGAGADLIADLLGHIKTIWIFLGYSVVYSFMA